MQQKKNISGYGLELDQSKITKAITNGVNVIQQNLNDGLSNFSDNSFDTVIMTQALQAVKSPDLILDEMLRVGREAIITFPNFGYWQTRYYLSRYGRMPVSKTLTYSWYDTPNIHLCTCKDFENLCKNKGFRITQRSVVNNNHQEHWLIQLMPNLLGQIAIYRVTNQ